MKTHLFLALIFSLFFSQNSATAQQFSIGTASGSEIQEAGCATHDGGYAAVGRNVASDRMQLILFNPNRTVKSKLELMATSRTLRPADMAPAASATAGGTIYTQGVWVTGTANFGTTSRIFLMRMNLLGGLVWCKELSTTLSHGARAVVPVNNGNVVVLGMKTDQKPTLTCFNAAGTVVWGPFVYTHPTHSLNVESATYDNNTNRIIVTGSTQLPGETGSALVFSVSPATGTPSWASKFVSTTATDICMGLDVASQVWSGTSRVAFTGYVTRSSQRDILFATLDPSTGVTLSGTSPRVIRQTSGGSEEGRSICSAGSGKWAIAGRYVTDRVCFMELSSAGAFIQGRGYPLATSSSLLPETISRKSDGSGYFITANRSGFDFHDMWLDNAGQTPCASSNSISMSSEFTILASNLGTISSSTTGAGSWSTLTMSMVLGDMPVTEHYYSFGSNPTMSNTTITPCTTGSSTLCANPTGGQAPYTYQWSNGATGNCTTVSPTSTTAYECTVKDATGCSFGIAFLVKVLNSSSLLNGVNAINVTGNSAQITAVSEQNVSGYRVNFRKVGTGVWTSLYSPTLPIHLPSLSCGTMYEAMLRAEMCGYSTGQAGVVFFTAACTGGEADERSAEPAESTEDVIENSYSAYPNPTTGLLTLNWEKSGSVREIRILSADGKLMEAIHPTDAQQMEIDLGNQNSGLYMVQFFPENGKPTAIRVLKN
jgi:hypothetical protein